MGSGVGVIAAGEVPVVGGDDGVGLALLDVLPVPLTDARSACISKDNAAEFLHSSRKAVSLNGSPNLLRSRSDVKVALKKRKKNVDLTGKSPERLISHCGNYGNLISIIFDKNFVKATFLLNN